MIKIDGYLKHSTRRAADRYGLEIDPSEYEALSARIASGQSDGVRLSGACGGRGK